MLKNFAPNSRFLKAVAPATKVACRNHGVPHAKLAAKDVERVPKTRESLLADRTAFITNCNEENGDLASNIALAYASHGASVLVHGENEAYLSELVSKFSIHKPSQCHGLIVDGIENVNTDLVSQFSDKLDILVHSTGAQAPKADEATDCDLSEFDGVVRESLTTPFAVVQRLLPLVYKGNNPSIILSSSTIEAENSEENELEYYVSKFGFNSSRMLTKMLAKALAKKNIRVNTVDPGNLLPHEIQEKALAGRSESAKTSAFVWLGRDDTQMSGSQLEALEWIRRDPMMFKSFY